ncbi:MAG: hypothetical protein IPH93_10595 [Saprospiraceae bacterium]|nr:hypothetical protein [Saprospiraceae bacterium]MBK9632735.1 hypothetical protein [Saprospiraceae bacterium]
MKLNYFFSGLLFISVTIICACGGDNDTNKSCSVAFSTELQAEINALNAAAQAYGMDPTPAKCLAYKNAAQAYVDALVPYGNCSDLVGQARTNWEASLSSARASVAAIQC